MCDKIVGMVLIQIRYSGTPKHTVYACCMRPKPKAKVRVMLFLSEKFYFRITRNFFCFLLPAYGLLTI